ncbi:PspA/IM30 family protein [Parerythrobacter aestuarii]|uniref:PspA/IM30 family protein n=1 Tax=Parerythrobacter aestuarii TaxID=3020909 RepID=UPI0024DE4BD6|nr:PspA/IM30 family protein [Parerythrobacter aestuarii]
MSVIVQIRNLVSSNVTAAVDSASDPAKMLRQLQREIEEALIGLEGEISRGSRQHARHLAKAEQFDASVDDWNGKARTAMDHDREDLARGALLAREDAKVQAQSERKHADALEASLEELKSNREALEAKLAEVRERHAEVNIASAAAAASSASSDSKADRMMDRIDQMERRIGFAVPEGDTKSSAAIEAELATLSRNKAVDADLEALKSSAKKPSARKRKSKS